MITPPGSTGVAFSEASDGDLRPVSPERRAASSVLGISGEWASLDQVHGNEVVRVSAPGVAAEADALWTSVRALPIAVFTADCFGVVLQAADAVGVAHVGWRGADLSTVTKLTDEMSTAGSVPARAFVGPGIGPCCFEVGPEVSSRFPGKTSETSWGTVSVDLREVIRGQVADFEVWEAAPCTMHDQGFFSHRRNADPRRLASIAWLP